MGIFERPIKSRQEFSGRGDQSDFEGFSVGAQTLVEGFEYGVEADGIEGRHLQGGAHGSPPTGDVTLAAPGAAVVVVGSEAGKGRNGVILEVSQLREMAEEDGGGAWADSLEGV